MEQENTKRAFSSFVLSIFGAGLSLILLYHWLWAASGLQDGPSFCSISKFFNCDKTNESIYSVMLGFPLASWGTLFYFLVGTLSLSRLRFKTPGRDDYAKVMFFVSVPAVLLSIYLLLVSEFIIEAMCPLCLGLYIINFSLLVLAAKEVRQSSGLVDGFLRGGFLLVSAPIRLIVVKDSSFRRRLSLGVVLFVLECAFVAYLPRVIFAVFFPSQAELEKMMAQKALPEWHNVEAVTVPVDSSGTAYADYSKGDPAAPVHIVEFADFECPMCRITYPVIEEVIRQYPGKIYFTFKHYPLDNSCNPTITHRFHDNSCYASKFTRCAGEQGKYWEALDFVFTLPALDQHGRDPAIARDAISSGVKALELDPAGMDECMASRRQDDALLRDITDGAKVNIEGTPTVFVNGKKLPQASKTFMTVAIEEALSGGGRP